PPTSTRRRAHTQQFSGAPEGNQNLIHPNRRSPARLRRAVAGRPTRGCPLRRRRRRLHSFAPYPRAALAAHRGSAAETPRAVHRCESFLVSRHAPRNGKAFHIKKPAVPSAVARQLCRTNPAASFFPLRPAAHTSVGR